MSLHWPQYVWLAFAAFGLIAGAVMDGQAKRGTTRFSHSLLGVLFSAWLLWCGGFFTGCGG